LFEALTEKLGSLFQRLGNKGRLTEQDVDEALKEIRIAFLEADVNFKLAREFVGRVRDQAVGIEVLTGANPGAQVAKIVNDELVNILAGGNHQLEQASFPPTVIMLVGLQGSGKTTTAAKLAVHLQKGSTPNTLLVAADLQRPAAIQQLQSLGQQLGIPVYAETPRSTPLGVVQGAISAANDRGLHWMIIDTAGRQQIDADSMAELAELKAKIRPLETLLVLDAMTGQEAVNAAQEFHNQVGLSGVVLTKLDGDARGGAALSISAITGVPIKFIGVGERTDALEQFHPDRLASRILGMGDMLTLVEKAQQALDGKQTQEMERKFRRAEFDLQDMLEQLQAVQRMGPLTQVLEMIPGFSKNRGAFPESNVEEERIKRIRAIILSMTPGERRGPGILNGSRRRRIALGSGTSVQEINQLLNQFKQMQHFVKQAAQGRSPFKIPKF